MQHSPHQPQFPMKTKTRSFTACARTLLFATLASAFIGSAAVSQAQGTVYAVHIVGFQKTFATNFYPPRTGGFFSENEMVFAGGATAPGAVLRKFSVKFSRSVQPDGSPGQFVSSPGQCSGEISLDGGVSFAGWSGACTGVLRLTPSSTAPGTFDTEMLSLDISSSSLPAGVMLRESPTRQSTGRVSPTLLSDGRYQIDSFFDIFTELSFDSGNTWNPQGALPGHCTLGEAVAEVFAPTDFFPPARAIGTFSDGTTADITAGSTVLRLKVWQLMQGQTGAQALPVLGSPVTATRTGEIEGELSVDGGVTFTPFHVSATSAIEIARQAAGGPTTFTFDTSIFALACTIPTGGGGGGGAGGSVMLRESPTKQSLGQHTVRRTADGNFRIASFFDIFTEVSLDGGATWTEAASAVRVRGIGPDMEPDQTLFTTNFFPPRTGVFTVGKGAQTLSFSSGRHIGNVRLTCRSANVPLTTGMAVADLDADGHLDFVMQAPGSSVLEPVSGAVSVRVAVGDVNGDGIFETEMLSLDFTASSSSVMLRESPTRQSTGKTASLSVTGSPGGTCRIQSFFDIFTEMSLDGGATWFPADAPLRLALASSPPENFTPSDFLPPTALVSRNVLKTFFETGDIPNAEQFGDVLDSFVSPGSVTGNPVAIRRLQIGDPDFDLLRVAPPAPGASITLDRDTTVQIEYTTDSGVTWTWLSCDATVTQRFTAIATFSDGYSTEMLALSLNGLPPGQPFRIRESPTRASLGRTSISQVSGGSRISGFFDIFTEVSIDDGTTWLPAARPMHCDLQAATAQPIAATTASFPTPGELGEAAGGLGAQTALGRKQKAWLCSNFRLISGGGSPSSPGATVTCTQEGSVSFLWKNLGDPDFSEVSAPITLTTVHATGLTDQIRDNDEVTFLSISGGTLPPGVMIRESPTLASRGPRQTLTVSNIGSSGNDGARVSSFFDVFTEISVNGGATWEPCDLPIRLDLLPPVQKVTQTVPTFPPASSLSRHYIATGNFADGTSVQAFGTFSDGAPLDSLAIIAILSKKSYDYYQTVRLGFQPAGDVTVTTISSSAHFVLDATRSIDDGTTMVFDTEMLSLDFSDATAGVMLRESPSKQSLGRTTIEPLADGTYRIGSFFDIFTEISFDGGATWSASDGPLRLESSPAPAPVITVNPQPVLTVIPRRPASFHVACEPSLSPLHFTWLKAGVPIVGAPDSPDFTIPVTLTSHAGFYSCRVSNAGGSVDSAAGELIVRNPFLTLAGKYNGHVTVLKTPMPVGTPVLHGGYYSLSVSTLGGYSGVIYLDGVKYPVKGTFDTEGVADIVIPAGSGAGPHVRFTLTDSTSDVCDITVDFAGVVVATGTAPKNVFHTTRNPATQAGAYTAMLPAPPDQSHPQGDGYAVMSVTAGGAVKLTGRAGDNTPFSFGGFLSPEGRVPFYAALKYPAPGSLQGTLQCRDLVGISDCDGDVLCYKPAQTPAPTGVTPYPAGFEFTSSLAASRYIAPPLGSPMLVLPPPPGNYVIRCEGAIPMPFEKILSISSSNLVTVDNPGPDLFFMSLMPKTGIVKGSFFDVSSGKKLTFNGVVLQKTTVITSVYYKATTGKTGKASQPR